MEVKKEKSLTGNINSPKKYEPAPTNVNGMPAGNVQMPMNGMPQISQEELQKQMQEFEKLKGKLEVFKKAVLKKFKFTIGIALLPVNSSYLFEEDEALPKEVIESKPLHVMVVIPEEEFKNLAKIKPELVKLAKETKENIWIHIKTPVDLWNYGLDSKFEMVDAISGGYPVYDNGFLGALRVASIHKSLILRKFEKYVTTYVVAGSLVRGTASKDSDVDVFVVIDDTDVKRMPRMELLEKLRGIIYDYIREATALAGVKNILNVQVYLLTDFWQSVKDAHPVMFTFIRDGIPLYDRGTFIPWKLLLYTGRIKPSPEAIDLYMKEGDRTEEMVKRRLLDSMIDSYYGIVTPTQAMFMLAGEPTPVPKVLPEETRKIFKDKYGMMEEKYLKTLEKAVKMFKEYEYGKLKEVPGKEIDVLLQECKEYNVMLKQLRGKIEKKMQIKSANDIYNETFTLFETILGKKPENKLIKEFESKLVKQGKIQERYIKVLKEIIHVKDKVKAGKVGQKEVDNVKREAFELIRSLVEYAQRADLLKAEKGTMQIIYNGRKAELVLFGKDNFLIEGRAIKRITDSGFQNITKEEFDKSFEENKGKLSTSINANVFKVLEKELGHFDIVF